jgi:hypothetical protein
MDQAGIDRGGAGPKVMALRLAFLSLYSSH